VALFALALSPAPGARAASSDAPAEAAAVAQQKQILGRWLTETRDGIIEISAAADGTYQGRLIGSDHAKRVDTNNPDPAKRSELVLGQVILLRLSYKGQGEWSGGSVYDPTSGRFYRCSVEMIDQDHLRLRGFVGISILGRSQVWTRYTGTSLEFPLATH
jgi:uncharacterized protein (DUF2147 family)